MTGLSRGDSLDRGDIFPHEVFLKLQYVAFLIGGLFYGALVSFAAFWVIDHRPGVDPGQPPMAAAPAMVPAPAVAANPGTTQGGGAPMMAQIGELRRQVEANPQDRNALLQLGDLYGQVGMWNEAASFFEQAMVVDPSDRALTVQIGDFHYDRAQWNAAVRWYDRALQLVPDDPNVLTDRGFCLKEMGERERALESFARANELDPSHWRSLYNTVVVAGLELGRFAEAHEALAKLEANPDAEGVPELRRALEQAFGQAAENPS